MKTSNILLVFYYFSFSFISTSQSSFENEFSAVKKELTHWDPIRGEWLANSILAIADKKPIPDRTFPEDFTPYQMATMIPLDQRRGISQLITQTRNAGNSLFSNHWNLAEMIFNHSFCSTLIGRSYGDPHLRSFDQATYSFQTVGEFVVTKSAKNHFEVQARQSPQDKNFSLNTAVALNVAGDRLCYYSGDKPDGNFSPWRLNGQPLSLNGRTYFLPNGGTLSLNGRFYTISWPTGENVIVESRSSQMGFVNLTVEVFDCDRGDFEGLLGNANGIMDDDFNGRSSNRQRPVYASFSSFGNPMLQQATVTAEREYLNFLTRDFAEDWRVTDQTSLFDYAIGLSTASFTDRTFPVNHFTVSDLSTDRRELSRRRCEEQGVTADEMPGCIFDNGFLDLKPSPVPKPENPTRGVTLNRIERRALNNNQGSFRDNLNVNNPTTLQKESAPNNPILQKTDANENSNNSIGGGSGIKINPGKTFEIKTQKTESTPRTPPSKTPANPPIQKSNVSNGVKVKKG
jgi:hypothetical protein